MEAVFSSALHDFHLELQGFGPRAFLLTTAEAHAVPGAITPWHAWDAGRGGEGAMRQQQTSEGGRNSRNGGNTKVRHAMLQNGSREGKGARRKLLQHTGSKAQWQQPGPDATAGLTAGHMQLPSALSRRADKGLMWDLQGPQHAQHSHSLAGSAVGAAKGSVAVAPRSVAEKVGEDTGAAAGAAPSTAAAAAAGAASTTAARAPLVVVARMAVPRYSAVPTSLAFVAAAVVRHASYHLGQLRMQRMLLYLRPVRPACVRSLPAPTHTPVNVSTCFPSPPPFHFCCLAHPFSFLVTHPCCSFLPGQDLYHEPAFHTYLATHLAPELLPYLTLVLWNEVPELQGDVAHNQNLVSPLHAHCVAFACPLEPSSIAP